MSRSWSVKKNCAPSLRVIRQIAASRVVSRSRCARIAGVMILGMAQPTTNAAWVEITIGLPESADTLATRDDIDGILELQERNLPDQGGTLSARFPRARFEAAIAAMPLIVAHRNGLVVGY